MRLLREWGRRTKLFKLCQMNDKNLILTERDEALLAGEIGAQADGDASLVTMAVASTARNVRLDIRVGSILTAASITVIPGWSSPNDWPPAGHEWSCPRRSTSGAMDLDHPEVFGARSRLGSGRRG